MSSAMTMIDIFETETGLFAVRRLGGDVLQETLAVFETRLEAETFAARQTLATDPFGGLTLETGAGGQGLR